MKCDIPAIAEASESVHLVQVTDEHGWPDDMNTLDSILWTLKDSDDTPVNGQQDIEVLDDNGGEWTPTLGIASLSISGPAVELTFSAVHSLEDGMFIVIHESGTVADGRRYSVRRLSHMAVELVAANARDFQGWASTGDEEATIALLRLPISAEDNSPAAVLPASGRWRQYSELAFLAAGTILRTASQPYDITPTPP